jgi:hypothetical protein
LAQTQDRGLVLNVDAITIAVAPIPSTEIRPPTVTTVDTIDTVVKEGKKIGKIITCHRKTLKLVAGGKVYDRLKRDECVKSVKEKVLAKLSGLVPRQSGERADEALPCAASETGGLEAALDLFDTEFVRNLCPLFCCGAEPLPDDYCGYVPDTSEDPACTFKTIDKVGKALQKFAKVVLACHGDFVDLAVEEDEVSIEVLESCEDDALLNSLDKALSKIGPLPECVLENLPQMAEDILSLYRQKADQVVCEGTELLDPRGCCDTGVSCTQVEDEASCAGTFVQGALCNTETGGCRPTTCPFPSECSAGEDCETCPQNCGACTPTPAPPTPTPTPSATLPPCGDAMAPECNGSCPATQQGHAQECLRDAEECICVPSCELGVAPACGMGICPGQNVCVTSGDECVCITPTPTRTVTPTHTFTPTRTFTHTLLPD